MAIPVINSQGTLVYVGQAPTSSYSGCSEAVADLLANGVMVECPQSLGELTETRDMQEYKCLSSDESAKSLGAISRGSIDIEMLFDPDDIKGQTAIKDAFKNNTPLVFGIVVGETTMFVFQGLVSSVSTTIAQDEAVMYTTTVEISSEILECDANLAPNDTTFVSADVVEPAGLPVQVAVTLSDDQGYASVAAEWVLNINGADVPTENLSVTGKGTTIFQLAPDESYHIIVTGDVLLVSHPVEGSGLEAFTDEPVTNGLTAAEVFI